jgi:hypothetical protein
MIGYASAAETGGRLSSPACLFSSANPSALSQGLSTFTRQPSIAASSQTTPYYTFKFRSGARPGYRRHRAGAHLILFRQIAGAIDVVRVLHERMDVASHLPDMI